MRRVKTRHQRLSTRVETVRDELQRFLEDDDDMIKMCLTRKQALLRSQMYTAGALWHQAASLGVCTGSRAQEPQAQLLQGLPDSVRPCATLPVTLCLESMSRMPLMHQACWLL